MADAKQHVIASATSATRTTASRVGALFGAWRVWPIIKARSGMITAVAPHRERPHRLDSSNGLSISELLLPFFFDSAAHPIMARHLGKTCDGCRGSCQAFTGLRSALKAAVRLHLCEAHGCAENGFRGTRFKCLECADFDLCQSAPDTLNGASGPKSDSPERPICVPSLGRSRPTVQAERLRQRAPRRHPPVRPAAALPRRHMRVHARRRAV